ncbi:MAG TPA: hypothetical protein VGH29_14300 [Candidatus Binataceae bacterium]
MGYDIRPLSFTEILDRAFAVVRDQFWLLVGISAVQWIPYGVLLAIAPKNLAVQGLAVLMLLVVAPVTHTALVVAVVGVYLGLPASVSEAYRATRPILAAIIGTYLLMYLLVIPLMLLLVLPAVYFMTCWVLVSPIMIVEESFGLAALRRSRALVRGSWWRTFGLMMAVALIVTVPAAALQIFWSFIPLVGPILDAATQAVTQSYGLVAVVIYYFDRRCRTEDFDLRLLALQIRSESTAPVPGTSLA